MVRVVRPTDGVLHFSVACEREGGLAPFGFFWEQEGSSELQPQMLPMGPWVNFEPLTENK